MTVVAKVLALLCALVSLAHCARTARRQQNHEDAGDTEEMTASTAFSTDVSESGCSLADMFGKAPLNGTYGTDSKIRDLRARIKAFGERLKIGNFSCRDPNVEGPEEIYSDAIIKLSWAYCADKFGGTVKGSGSKKMSDRQRLGITSSTNHERDGSKIWPYNRNAGRLTKVRKNQAAGRVADAAGGFGWIGTRSTAILGLIDAVMGGTPEDVWKQAIEGFIAEEEHGLISAWNELRQAFKAGRSHPTKILRDGKAKAMMSNCGVPSSVQRKFHAYATSLVSEPTA